MPIYYANINDPHTFSYRALMQCLPTFLPLLPFRVGQFLPATISALSLAENDVTDLNEVHSCMVYP